MTARGYCWAALAAGFVPSLTACTAPRPHDGPLIAMRIEPTNPSLDEGTTLALQAIAVYEDGFKDDVTDENVTWTSTDTGVATVSPDGVLSGVVAGETRLVAQFGGIASVPEVATVRPLATPTPTPGNCDTGVVVLLSEVLYDANSTDLDKEYIEIHNPGLNPLDISGWSVHDVLGASAKTFVLPIPLTIDAGDFLVISDGDATAFQTEYGSLPDISGSGISLGNSGGDIVILEDCQGTQVDAVVYGPAADAEPVWTCVTTPPTAGTGQSIERNPPGTDTDDCTDWESDKTPTPGMAPL